MGSNFLRLSLGLGIFLWRVLAQRVPVKLFITYGQTAWSMASHPVTFEARSFACNCDHAQWRADKHPAQYLHDFRRNTSEVRSLKRICCFLKGFGFLLQEFYWSVSDSTQEMGMRLKVPVTPLASANWCKKFSDPVFWSRVHQSRAHEKKF